VTKRQREEIRSILKSLQNDLDNASNAITDQDCADAKAEAVEAALVCLLDALADNN
jgi:hypothetical protein